MFEDIITASDRPEKELSAEESQICGIFQGLLFETGLFDLVPLTGKKLHGKISDDFTDNDLERIYALQHQQVIAATQETTVTQKSCGSQKSYMLKDAYLDTSSESQGDLADSG
jgi:hypothetical protein